MAYAPIHFQNSKHLIGFRRDRREAVFLYALFAAVGWSLMALSVNSGSCLEWIDFGGHPNERSVTGNMKMVDEPDRRTMLAMMLHGPGWALDYGLDRTVRCGLWAA